MSPVFPARRRAEEFDRLVEATASTSTAGVRSQRELVRLAALATSLRDLPQIEPSAAFSADLRGRLMAAAATELSPAPATAPRSVEDRLTVRRLSGSTKQSRRQRRLTAAILTFAVVAGTAGTAVASRDVLPGDTLYPVKRAIENLQTGFSVSDASKGSTLLSDADTRLHEVHALTHAGHPANGNEVRTTLETFASQATQASDLLLDEYKNHQDPKTIQRLRNFAAQGIDQLGQLQAAIPADAQSALSDAAQALLLIDQAAQALCPGCGGQGIAEIPPSLLQSLADGVTGLTKSGGTAASQPGQKAGPQRATQPGRQTEANPPKLPSIPLPSVNPSQLLPGTVDPTSLLPGQPQSTDQQGGTTKQGGSSTQSGGSTSPSPSPSTAGDAVKNVVKDAGTAVGGLLNAAGSLLGGG